VVEYGKSEEMRMLDKIKAFIDRRPTYQKVGLFIGGFLLLALMLYFGVSAADSVGFND
jgi:hypothetical protein